MSKNKEQEFSPNKSHSENVQVSINKILGQPTSLRKAKKSQEDHRKILFSKIITAIDELNDRSYIMDEQLDLDLTKYDRGFFDVIDLLLELHFTHQQLNLINFYLYDRYNADGTICELYTDDGEMIPLNTPEELYFFLNNMIL